MMHCVRFVLAVVFAVLGVVNIIVYAKHEHPISLFAALAVFAWAAVNFYLFLK